MDPVNIASPEFTYDETDPAGYRAGMLRLGPLVGGSAVGASLYHLPPGEALCPYHYEYGEEEWMLVLEGAPTLRRPDGEQVLRAWDVVCFPSGPDGAHKIANASAETVRVLMFSNVTHPCATVYPDSGKMGIWSGNPDDSMLVRKADAVTYYEGEPTG
ncbi:MAG: hypothetical protein QOE98_1148 [Gaiellaceae bacterium]|jgi:uncharacterized cupin superfamily protein|nr:hypothetical protein [Gaiellaceae bacterium]